MGKGGWRRPSSVDYNTYSDNWDKCFGSPEELIKRRFAKKKEEKSEENNKKSDISGSRDRTAD